MARHTIRPSRLLLLLAVATLLVSGCRDLGWLPIELPAPDDVTGEQPDPGDGDAGDPGEGDADDEGDAGDPDDVTGEQPDADEGDAGDPGEGDADDEGDAGDPDDVTGEQPDAGDDGDADDPGEGDAGDPDDGGGNAPGAYGAGKTGPAAESCETSGTQANGTGAVKGNGTFLLRGGDYGSLDVPPGATVKPYNCERVTIVGQVSLGDGATLAGVTVRSDSSWVIKIGGRNITVRNSTVNGGSTEAIRIYDDARNVELVGNNLDGGRNNHVVKVKAENSSKNPDGIVIANNRFSKTYYGGSSEDLLQLEGHNHVEVTNNTFADNPRGEDGLDVKQGTEGILVEGNQFEGAAINAECLLVQGGYAENIVKRNSFTNCKGVSLGAHPELKQDPWWRFEGNELRNSMLRLRRSENAEIINDKMTGGTFKLGTSNGDDTPRNVRLSGNTFSGVKIENNMRAGLTCSNNVLLSLAGGGSLGC